MRSNNPSCWAMPAFSSYRFRSAFSLLLFLISSYPTLASISVAPSQLFIDAKRKIGEVYITNTSSNMVDVAIEFKFGFPVFGEDGKVTIPLHERTYEHPKTIAPFLYVYPRRLTLYPGQTRTVRIVVRAPEGLSEGEYWARVVFNSEAKGDVQREDEASGKVSSVVNIKYAIIIPVYYRVGSIYSDVDVLQVDATLRQDSLHVTSQLQRKGNGAYLGIRKVQLLNASGDVVYDAFFDYALYESGTALDKIAMAGLPRGKYTVRMTYTTVGRIDAMFLMPSEDKIVQREIQW